MIWTGLAGWGDHDSLYHDLKSTADKLSQYAGHFPIVELDASFYAVQPERNMNKWVNDTPESFQFVVKAYQGMTGHQRGEIPFDSKEEMFEAFKKSLEPMRDAGKLAMVLLQFPPWFDCRKENVDYLRYSKRLLEDIPSALEFRHQSWFSPQYRERTIQYMKEDNWIHSICDEPQAGEKSIPFVPVPVGDKTLVRLHGRNVHGWTKPSKGQEWRDVRYLYDYSESELTSLVNKIQSVAQDTGEVFVIFNNNSGGHAAGNASRFMEIAGLKYKGLAPRQMDLFD